MDGSTTRADRLPPLPEVAVAVAAGVAGVLGSYGAAGFTPSFVLGPVAGVLSKRMPGVVLTFAITVLGDLGTELNLLAAGGIVVVLFALLARIWIHVGRASGVRGLSTVGTGLSVWLLAAAITARPVPALGAGLAAAVVVGAADLSGSVGRADDEPDGRRRVVAAAGAVLGASLLGYVFGARSTTRAVTPASGSPDGTDGSGDPAGTADTSGEPSAFDVSELRALAADRSFEVEGLEPLVSEGFYSVDINAVDPAVDAEEWSLSLTGEVERELEFSLPEIAGMGIEHRFVTLRCVGESLNGYKMDTAIWSGVPVAGLIERAGPTSACDCVMLRAVDGYFVQFPLAALRPGLLAIGMNGDPLPRTHGAPLRALVPGHWGEVNAKWLDEIEFLRSEADGYWERRGWHGTGPVETVAKLHAREKRDGRLVVGGHAYAGTRGIEEVHVSTDGGGTWNEATLTDPLPGEDVWRQWKYSYDAPESTHEVVVRARDGTGRLQPGKKERSFPSGPGGWVRRSIDPGLL